MWPIPVQQIIRLSGRQRRLLEAARDRVAPGEPLAAFIARAASAGEIAESGRRAPRARHATTAEPRSATHIQPGSAAALEVPGGDVIVVEQVEGGQCVDLVAWSLEDGRERLSAARTRAISGVSPGVGDALWSGPPFERPLLHLVADSAPGHDLLFPACSAREYLAAGCGAVPSCAGVQAAAAAGWGIEAAAVPDPFNLWLRGGVDGDGALTWVSTPTAPGDHVALLAAMDLLVVVNPCVDDIFGCSGFEAGPIAVDVRRATAADHRGLPRTPTPPAATAAGTPRPLRRTHAVSFPPRPRWEQLELTVEPGAGDPAAIRASAIGYALSVVGP